MYLFITLFVNVRYINIIIIILKLYSPMRAWAYQTIIDLTSTCLQKEVKNHLDSLGVICCQHVKSSSHCRLSRTGLLLKISSWWYITFWNTRMNWVWKKYLLDACHTVDQDQKCIRIRGMNWCHTHFIHCHQTFFST